MSARVFWEMDSWMLVVWFNGKGSTIDISPESHSSKDSSKHLSFNVGIMAFGIGEGFAGIGHGFVVLKECCSKAYLWGINLDGHGKWRVKVLEVGVTNDSILYMLEGSILGWGSRWSLCPSWPDHAVGQSRWTCQGWGNFGMLCCLKTPGVWWHLLVHACRACMVLTFSWSGWTPSAS